MVFNVIGVILKLVVILTYFINHFNDCFFDYPKMFFSILAFSHL